MTRFLGGRPRFLRKNPSMLISLADFSATTGTTGGGTTNSNFCVRSCSLKCSNRRNGSSVSRITSEHPSCQDQTRKLVSIRTKIRKTLIAMFCKRTRGSSAYPETMVMFFTVLVDTLGRDAGDRWILGIKICWVNCKVSQGGNPILQLVTFTVLRRHFSSSTYKSRKTLKIVNERVDANWWQINFISLG